MLFRHPRSGAQFLGTWTVGIQNPKENIIEKHQPCDEPTREPSGNPPVSRSWGGPSVRDCGVVGSLQADLIRDHRGYGAPRNISTEDPRIFSAVQTAWRSGYLLFCFLLFVRTRSLFLTSMGLFRRLPREKIAAVGQELL